MTTPNGSPNNVVSLPAPQPPMLTRVVSDPLFNDQPDALVWALGGPHPLVPDTYKVLRMFVDRGGVEIYATDGKSGMRNLIPTSKVRFTEEAMPLNIFAEELYAAEAAAAPVGPLSAEAEADDDDDDDEPGPDPDETEEPATSEQTS